MRSLKFTLLSAALLLGSLPLTAWAEKKSYLGKFKVTYYWVAQEADYPGEGSESVVDESGKSLGTFSKRFARALKLEGSGMTADGRLLNVVSKKGGIIRFKEVAAPFGLGCRNNPLVPFRSIAVDKTVIPYGTVLYIPQAVGAKLPDGTVHDGYFLAADVGGGIKGNRLDLFTGLGDQRMALTQAGVKNLKEIELYKVEGSVKRPVLTNPPPRPKAGKKKEGKQGTVTIDDLNMRKGPGMTHEVIRSLNKGTRVRILKTQGAWIQVDVAGEKGWLFASYVKREEVPEKAPAPDQKVDMSKRMKSSMRASRAVAKRSWSQKKKYLHYRKMLKGFGYKLTTEYGQRTVVGLRGIDPERRVYSEKKRKIRQYNDTFVVLWINDKGQPRVEYFQGSTTPGQEKTKASGTPDPNKDGVKDIAHLAPGLYKYKIGTFKGLSAYRPVSITPCYRDTNQDGRIDKGEKKASKKRGDLATGILFHRGKDTRPSSVGCQTMNPKVFDAFEKALGGDKRFDYVLVDPR
ncbi:MAG: 3D domain-containing protein [Planctomycetota bacterium]|nr:3D domain-containing protein [Planctomycetota bacterium]